MRRGRFAAHHDPAAPGRVLGRHPVCERSNCKIDLPNTTQQVSQTVKRRDYKGVDLPGQDV